MNDIDNFLNHLGAQLKVNQKRKNVILKDLAEHFIDSIAFLTSTGFTKDDAVIEAIRRFGTVENIANQLNAAGGARSMRRAPIITLGSGVMVIVAFLMAARSLPRTNGPGSIQLQVTFFLAVIAMQFAIMAGARSASRALATWRTAAGSPNSRVFVQRTSIIAMRSLAIGVIAITVNLSLSRRHTDLLSVPQILAGIVLMISATTFGLIFVQRLNVNATNEDKEDVGFQSNRIFSFGETVFRFVYAHPYSSCMTSGFFATMWVMNHAEEKSFLGAAPWGIAELASVIIGFVLLGPALELRPNRKVMN